MIKKKVMGILILAFICLIFVTIRVDATTNNVRRIAGNNRYETATMIATEYLGDRIADNIMLASGDDYPDAISGGLLAKQKQAPILLIGGDSSINSITFSFAFSHIKSGGTFYILGGTGVVSSSIDSQLKAIGYTVVRLAGKDRYETSRVINDQVTSVGQKVVIADGNNFQECLIANSTSILNDERFYMVPADLNSKAIADLKADTSVNYVLSVGKLQHELLEQGNANFITKTTSSYDDSVYDTSNTVANSDIDAVNSVFGDTCGTNIICSGKNYPDGITAGSLVAKYKAPIVLMNDGTESTKKALTQPYIGRDLIIGGIGVVSPNAEAVANSGISSSSNGWGSITTPIVATTTTSVYVAPYHASPDVELDGTVGCTELISAYQLYFNNRDSSNLTLLYNIPKSSEIKTQLAIKNKFDIMFARLGTQTLTLKVISVVKVSSGLFTVNVKVTGSSGKTGTGIYTILNDNGKYGIINESSK